MRTFLVLAALIAILLFCADVAVEVAMVDPNMASHLSRTREIIEVVSARAWDFGRPLLQLVVVLLILEWVLGRVGIKWDLKSTVTNLNVQAFIAVVVISVFCLAVLGGIATEGLKEVALIVVGFYFGSTVKRNAPPPGLTEQIGEAPSEGPSPGSPGYEHSKSPYESASNRPRDILPPKERGGSSPNQAT